jgi:hypothetical protein
MEKVGPSSRHDTIVARKGAAPEIDMTGRQWRQKLFEMFCAASLWRRYVIVYGVAALVIAGWLFGPCVSAWWFDRPETLTWKLITSLLFISGFALFVAIYNLFWVNPATQARAIQRIVSDTVIPLLVRVKKAEARPRSGNSPE